MRKVLWIVAFVMVAPPSMAQEIQVSPGGVYIHPPYHQHPDRRGEYDCRRLRYHCVHKDELGEQGAGNCRRYHELCGGGDYQPD